MQNAPVGTYTEKQMNLTRFSPTKNPHTIDGTPINQTCAPGVHGRPRGTGSARYVSKNHTNNNRDSKKIVDLLYNFNSLIDVSRNSNVFNNLNNILNNNFKTNSKIKSTDSIQLPSCESTTNTNNTTKLAAALPNSIGSVALDSVCTDSSYRTSDALAQNIQILPISTNENLSIISASGESMKSYAKGVLEYSNNENYNQTINIFDDKQLTIGMHALNTFTNHPANCTVIFDKFVFKIIDPNHQVICQNSKVVNDKIWFMPYFIKDDIT